MKILKVRWSNFFSAGNHPIEIDLTKNERTLIVGENGAGKSTFVSAICFGLYGKPFKDVNKPTIINSINKKNLLVEVEIESKGKSYKIRRGMKPNVFEISEDGKVWKMDGKGADTQDVFEKTVLGMNFMTFKQKVVIGSGGYTPFMKLKTPERRSIVENILSLQVFTKMNALLKGHNDLNKEELGSVEKEEYRSDSDINLSKKKLSFLKEQRDKQSSQNSTTISENKKRIEEIDRLVEKNDSELTNLSEYKTEKNKNELQMSKVNVAINSLKESITKCERDIKSVDQNNFCSSCHQEIPEEDREKHKTELNFQKKTLQEKLEKAEPLLVKLEEKISEYSEKINSLSPFEESNMELNYEKKSLLKENEKLENISFDDAELVEEARNYKGLQVEKGKILSRKEKNLNTKEILSVAAKLLKDDGIKAEIISEYIPYINKTINEYLDIMNFYVQFEIDENFNEVIRSRHRDIFTYDNFSEGEKARIDLALLFAWRKVTKKRSNMECNVLIFDETFDSSLDFRGTEDLLRILGTFEDSNVFVISHKSDIMLEQFEDIITFEKKNNFSTMRITKNGTEV